MGYGVPAALRVWDDEVRGLSRKAGLRGGWCDGPHRPASQGQLPHKWEMGTWFATMAVRDIAFGTRV